MCQVKTAGWIIGVVIGTSIGVLLPTGLNIIAGLVIAVSVAKLFIKVSTIEIEEDEEMFL